MGLPMFKEPEERSPSKTAEKIDRAAASSRSAIRRERTVRGTESRRRFTDRHESRVAGLVVNDGFTSRTIPPRSSTRARLRRDTPLERTGRQLLTTTDYVHHVGEDITENVRRRQAGAELLRDALQYTSPGQRMRQIPRSPRMSALRFEVAPPPRSPVSPVSPAPEPDQESGTEPERSAEEQALLARPYMPSPPYSFRDAGIHGLRGTPGQLIVSYAEPTPGFAPAQGVHHDNEEREPVVRGRAPRDYTPPGESSWTASYPPLRRVGHLSPQPESRLSRYGGLGDRRRSISSESSGGDHDAWETLLTTMEPDAHLPSADSSFTSATASNSTRQSRHSSQTRTTSFATTATPTERHPSRPHSPMFPYPSRLDSPEMDLDIHSSQYSCLSEESRERMHIMLSIIRDSRDARAANPGTSAFERERRADENTIISNHLSTLRTLDDMRSSAAGFSRPLYNINHDVPGLMQHGETLQHRMNVAMGLARAMDRQARERERERERGTGDDHGLRFAMLDVPPRGLSHVAGAGFPRRAEDHMLMMETPRYARENGLGLQPETRPTATATTPNAENENEVEQDLESMQRVIERMAQREDIPDEWWAAAGLARTVRENH